MVLVLMTSTYSQVSPQSKNGGLALSIFGFNSIGKRWIADPLSDQLLWMLKKADIHVLFLVKIWLDAQLRHVKPRQSGQIEKTILKAGILDENYQRTGYGEPTIEV